MVRFMQKNPQKITSGKPCGNKNQSVHNLKTQQCGKKGKMRAGNSLVSEYFCPKIQRTNIKRVRRDHISAFNKQKRSEK